jgi:hypothetical protein
MSGISRIEVTVASTGDLLSAAYSPHSNTMTLAGENVLESGIGRSGILHEGVHAIVDLYRCTSTTALTDEVAAYLAERIYLYAGHIRFGGDAAAMKIYDAADKIAKARGLYTSKGKSVALALTDYEPLRHAIRANPAYSGIGADEMTTGHGIPLRRVASPWLDAPPFGCSARRASAPATTMVASLPRHATSTSAITCLRRGPSRLVYIAWPW